MRMRITLVHHDGGTSDHEVEHVDEATVAELASALAAEVGADALKALGLARAAPGAGWEPMPPDGLLRDGWVASGDAVALVPDDAGRFRGGAASPAPPPGRALRINRPPRVEPGFDGASVAVPPPPTDAAAPPLSWAAFLAPALLTGASAVVLDRPMLLVVAAASPLAAAAAWGLRRWRHRRRRRRDLRRFREDIAAAIARVEARHAEERDARERAAPTAAAVARAGEERDALLWSRRPTRPGFLAVRLGVAETPSAVSVDGGDPPPEDPALAAELAAVVQRAARLRAPLVERLDDIGVLGVVETPQPGARLVDAVLVQLLGLHAPGELVVAAILDGPWAQALSWLRWPPHTAESGAPFGGPRVATGAACGELLARVEAFAARRGEGAAAPHVVLVVADGAAAPRDRLTRLCERGKASGVLVLWIADAEERLPACCETVVDAAAARVASTSSGERTPLTEVERIAPERAERFARAIAPLVDAAAASDRGRPPDRARCADVHGGDPFDPGDVVERWRAGGTLVDRGAAGPRGAAEPGRLGARVGIGGEGTVRLELRTHGPHALVAGTTGSGKSELLRAWVLGMALETSPDRLVLLLVDYKGGAAFAECVRLPHCVGVLTDLDQALVRRALTSLRAELRRRERVLADLGVPDLVAAERAGHPEAPPSLVIVVDEFQALAAEHPDFVDGIVDLAQRGRSLGIHLILATQRPGGVIRDSVRANTNLRIALRTADAAESRDVVGVGDAADFDPAVPGRAVARLAPGRLVVFQSAQPGARSTGRPPRVSVRPLGAGGRGPAPPAATTASDGARMVEAMREAARGAGIPAPRRPWLDPLEPVVDVRRLPAAVGDGLVLGICDDPARQRRVPAVFRPDLDGHLAVVGAGGTGRTVALRTLAVQAARSAAGSPVHVYGIDAAGGGLAMLAALPVVGGIVDLGDADRIRRLLRRIDAELDRRAARLAASGAADFAEARARGPAEPRILLLVDGFPAFGDEWASNASRAAAFDTVLRVLADGRRLGVHVALSADRLASLQSRVLAGVRLRIALAGAEAPPTAPHGGAPGAPHDGAAPPPGRCLLDGLETQLGLLPGPAGGRSAVEQAAGIAALADSDELAGAPPAPGVGVLPASLRATLLPNAVDGRPALGIASEGLAACGFEPAGVLLVAGPAASGRSNAMRWLRESVRRFDPATRIVELEPAGASPRNVLEALRAGRGDRVAVFAERVADVARGADQALLGAILDEVEAAGHLLVVEEELSGWGAPSAIMQRLRRGSAAIVLRPEPGDVETLLGVRAPRLPRSEFPNGRGLHVERGAARIVQLPCTGG